MSLVSPQQILHDVFLEDHPRRRRPALRWPSIAYLVLPLAAGVGGYVFGLATSAGGTILAALAILTGITFAMAVSFWDRSIDARHDPFSATNAERLTVIDHMKSHLIYTVFVGVVATGALLVVALFVEPTMELPPLLDGALAFLSVYEVVLVGAALIEFYRASYELRP